ncbi:MAG: cupin domain-containing protein [Candidatus Peribacteraceae bacterium]
MKGFIVNLEQATRQNNDFRRVLYTAKFSQLVLMSIKPGEEIGEEVHTLDQFIRIEEGEGKAILDGVEYKVKSDDAVVIPAGTKHNIINTSKNADLKLYTIYSPPEHRDGVVHSTKADALRDTSDEFDGKTTNDCVE